jgi:hypothetical protein
MSPSAADVHRFQKNLRYDLMAEALGAHKEYVQYPSEMIPALEESFKIANEEQKPSVINCQGKMDFWLDSKRYPPGFLDALKHRNRDTEVLLVLPKSNIMKQLGGIGYKMRYIALSSFKLTPDIKTFVSIFNLLKGSLHGPSIRSRR